MTNRNEYMWNKILKFSWGHIIAFVALIFISYVAYMGAFYRNGGDFTEAAITVCIIDLLILISFIGAQIFKGSDEKLARSLIIERILVILCPIVFLGAMIPYNHFWNVFSERKSIESMFSESIENSSKMFDDYEDYAKRRIEAYEKHLNNHDNNGNAQFPEFNEIDRANYVETLRLQLLSQNTDNLKVSAKKWINYANKDASVWNAFLVGNVDMIAYAVEAWNNKLFEVTKPVLSNEPDNVKPFDSNHETFLAAKCGLKELREIYILPKGLNINTIWTGLILFFMLLFPYILQARCIRAYDVHLLPSCIRKHLPKKAENSNEENNSEQDIYDGTF